MAAGAVLIGLIAGLLLVGAAIFVAISVHGVNGAWGVIAESKPQITQI